MNFKNSKESLPFKRRQQLINFLSDEKIPPILILVCGLLTIPKYYAQKTALTLLEAKLQIQTFHNLAESHYNTWGELPQNPERIGYFIPHSTQFNYSLLENSYTTWSPLHQDFTSQIVHTYAQPIETLDGEQIELEELPPYEPPPSPRLPSEESIQWDTLPEFVPYPKRKVQLKALVRPDLSILEIQKLSTATPPTTQKRPENQTLLFPSESHPLELCHLGAVNLSVSSIDEANKHLKHGDLLGDCADRQGEIGFSIQPKHFLTRNCTPDSQIQVLWSQKKSIELFNIRGDCKSLL